MAYYDVNNLANFQSRSALDNLLHKEHNLEQFQTSFPGNANYVDQPGETVVALDPLIHTDPETPYVLTLEQQCNPQFRIVVPENPDAFFDGTGPLIDPSLIRVYFVQVSYGQWDDGAKDKELWQAWKSNFGFDFIPLGFAVGFTLVVGRGSMVYILYSDLPVTPQSVIDGVWSSSASYLFINQFDYTFAPFQVYNPFQTLFTSTYQVYGPQETMTTYIEYTDVEFETNYTEEYNIPSDALRDQATQQRINNTRSIPL